jgi:hypothetical protein
LLATGEQRRGRSKQPGRHQTAGARLGFTIVVVCLLPCFCVFLLLVKLISYRK